MVELILIVTILSTSAVILLYRYVKAKKHSRYTAFVSVPVIPDDDLLEKRVRALYWDEVFADISNAKEILLILDRPCSNVFTARRLEQELYCVKTVHITALKDYIIRKYFT